MKQLRFCKNCNKFIIPLSNYAYFDYGAKFVVEKCPICDSELFRKRKMKYNG